MVLPSPTSSAIRKRRGDAVAIAVRQHDLMRQQIDLRRSQRRRALHHRQGMGFVGQPTPAGAFARRPRRPAGFARSARASSPDARQRNPTLAAAEKCAQIAIAGGVDNNANAELAVDDAFAGREALAVHQAASGNPQMEEASRLAAGRPAGSPADILAPRPRARGRIRHSDQQMRRAAAPDAPRRSPSSVWTPFGPAGQPEDQRRIACIGVLKGQDGGFQLIAQPALSVDRRQKIEAGVEPGDDERAPLVARQIVGPALRRSDELREG